MINLRVEKEKKEKAMHDKHEKPKKKAAAPQTLEQTMLINNIVDNTFGLYQLDKSARRHSIKMQVAEVAAKVVNNFANNPMNKRASTQPQSGLT